VFKEAFHEPSELSKQFQKRIASLAEIIAIGRTHVHRNNFGNREIEYVPEPEANTRISKGLAAIARGIASLPACAEVEEPDLQDCFRVGLDCLSEHRRQLFLAVAKGDDPLNLFIAKTMRIRVLEELEGLHILKKSESNNYELEAKIARLWRAADVK
jgi:hypothetical protein